MNPEKHAANTRINVREMLDSVKAIKGETYADILEYISMSIHLTKIISVLTRQQPGIVTDGLQDHFVLMMTKSCDLLFGLCQYSDKDIEEIFGWAEKISEQVDNGLATMMRNKR